MRVASVREVLKREKFVCRTSMIHEWLIKDLPQVHSS